jgi:hypothetical protein
LINLLKTLVLALFLKEKIIPQSISAKVTLEAQDLEGDSEIGRA